MTLHTIADVHADLRWLDLAHLIEPQQNDNDAYQRLVTRMNDALLTLLTETTGPPPRQSALPADLANTAFPTSIGEALTTPPATSDPPLTDPPDQRPDRHRAP